MDSFLRMKLSNKYNLYHRQRMSLQLLNTIYTNEKIEKEDMYRIFDISQAARYKFRKNINCSCFITIYSQNEIETFKNIIINTKDKIYIEILKEKYKLTDKAINEIRKGCNSKSTLKLDLDIKYIYGDMSINKDDIEKIKRIYNSNEDEIIKNIAKHKRIYSVYKYALENNNKGIIILKDTRMSNKFFEDIYQDINSYLEIKSNIKCSAYKCFDIKDDLKSEAYEQIYRNGGIFENNIKNKKLTMVYLLNLAESSMNSFISKRPKFASLIYKVNGVEIEREIPDNRYNPEDILMNKE